MARGALTVKILGDNQDLSRAVDDSEGILSRFAGGMGSIVSGAGIALGVAGAAGAVAFAAGFSNALDLGASVDRLGAQLNLTEAEAARVGGVGADLYAQAWGSSIDEVNAAIGSIGVNLVDLASTSDDELSRITAGVLDLSSAFGQEFNEVTRAAGQLVRTGLASDVTEALDLITVGFQTGGDRAGDFLDTLNEYAEPLASLGFDGFNALNAIAGALEAGAFNADKAGDAIKEFSIRAIDGSESSRAAIQSLGFDYEDMASKLAEGGPAARAATSQIIQGLSGISDRVEQDAAGVALFGATWEDLGPDVIAALDPVAGAIDDVSGRTEALGETLNDNLGTKIEALKRGALTELTTFMADNVVPHIEDVVDAFGEDGFAGAIRVVGDKISEAVPVMLAAIQDALPRIVTTLGEWARAFVDWVGPQIPPLLVKLAELASSVMTWITDEGLPALIANIESWASAFTEWVEPKIPVLIGKLGELLSEALSFIGDALELIIPKLAEWAAAFIEWVGPMIPPLLVELAKLVGQIVAWLVPTGLGLIVGAFVEIGGAIILVVAQWIVDLVSAFPGYFVAFLSAVGREAAKIPGTLIEAIGDLASVLLEKGKEWGKGIIDGIVAAIRSGAGRITGAIPGVGGGGDGFGSPGSELNPFGDVPIVPLFHSGGVVPGRPGEEVMTKLMAGETVLPTHERPLSDFQAGGKQGLTVNIYNPSYDLTTDLRRAEWLARAG